MSLTMTPQHVSDDTKSSTQIRTSKRARLLLSDIAIFNFTGSFAAKAARRNSMKSPITASTPISPTITTAMCSPRPKLQRRHGSDQLSFEIKAEDDKHLVKQSMGLCSTEATTFSTTLEDDLEYKDLNAGIFASPPAHDNKPVPTNIRIAPAQASPINVTVHAIESDDEDDDEKGASQVPFDEGGVSYVEYAECHDAGVSHSIDASPSVDYDAAKAGYVEQNESTYTSPPTFLPRQYSHAASEHSYHTLGCISETPSSPTSPTSSMSSSHFPFSPNITAMLTTLASLKQQGITTSSISVPKLVLTPPDGEATDTISKHSEVVVDDYDAKGRYVRARGIGHGRD